MLGIMEYTTQLAKPYIGKRVIVSLRHIGANGEETYSGLWGIIYSVHDGGLLLEVEGGIDEQFWMLPPTLESLIPARAEIYQHEGMDKAVVDVDYEAYYSTAESPDILDSRDGTKE